MNPTVTTKVSLGGDIERLQDSIARTPLTLQYALRIAAQVARGLARLHGQRRAHGAVVMGNLLVCDGQGWLAPPQNPCPGAGEAGDVRQFRDLFRAIFAQIPDAAAAAAIAEMEDLLEADALPRGEAPAGGRMSHVADGLTALLPRLSSSASSRAASRKVIMLVRAVPPGEAAAPLPAPLRRFGLPRLYASLLAGWAVGIAASYLILSQVFGGR
jgi:hypothetical protein